MEEALPPMQLFQPPAHPTWTQIIHLIMGTIVQPLLICLKVDLINSSNKICITCKELEVITLISLEDIINNSSSI